MAKFISDRMRRALDDPKTRYRLVDAWVLYQRRETLLAEKEQRVAARRSQQGQPIPAAEQA